MIATTAPSTFTVLEIRPAAPRTCPMCGQALPAPFFALYRVRGEPLQLMDPGKIGGRWIKSGGKTQHMQPVEIVRLTR